MKVSSASRKNGLCPRARELHALRDLRQQQQRFHPRRAFADALRHFAFRVLPKRLVASEIADQVGSSLQNVSQHLNLLKKSGIVTSRRAGQTIYYQIVDHEYLRNCPALLRVPEKLE